MFFMVFAATRNDKTLQWGAPAGVFEAATAEAACQAAAKKVGWMGSYFAIEGFPWGVELLAPDAAEFGANSEVDVLQNRIRELERPTGIAT